jgi:hypothetical protein
VIQVYKVHRDLPDQQAHRVYKARRVYKALMDQLEQPDLLVLLD